MNQIQQRNYSSIERMSESVLRNQSVVKQPQIRESNLNFSEILKEKQGSITNEFKLKFSKHAGERLTSRNIDLTHGQLERLVRGTQKAQEKGITESLVMIDNLAFIVNTKSNTVITALSDKDDKVFTNIDGAVIV